MTGLAEHLDMGSGFYVSKAWGTTTGATLVFVPAETMVAVARERFGGIDVVTTNPAGNFVRANNQNVTASGSSR